MEIVKFREYSKNTLQGFVDIRLTTGIILREFTYHIKNSSEWVNPPARLYKDKDGSDKWARIIDFDSKEIYHNFSTQVVKLLKEYIESEDTL